MAVIKSRRLTRAAVAGSQSEVGCPELRHVHAELDALQRPAEAPAWSGRAQTFGTRTWQSASKANRPASDRGSTADRTQVPTASLPTILRARRVGEIVASVMAVGPARRLQLPSRAASLMQPCSLKRWSPSAPIWTPFILAVESLRHGNVGNGRTILVWEPGGEISDGSKVLRLQVCRRRPPLRVGARYLLLVEECSGFAQTGGGFHAIKAELLSDSEITSRPALARTLHSQSPPLIPGFPSARLAKSVDIHEKLRGPQLGAIQHRVPTQAPSPAGLAARPHGPVPLMVPTTCGTMTWNSRWDYNPPNMHWDVSLGLDFDESLKDTYLAAAAQWSGAQAGAPQAAGQNVAAIEFFASVWDPAQFVDVPEDRFEGVTAATLGLAWQDANFSPDHDTYAGVWTLVNNHEWLETCLGVSAPKLEYVRVIFNTNFLWNDITDQQVSPNTQGVWVHEIGHMLGLPHRLLDCPESSIMKPGGTIASTWTNWYAQDDDDWRIQELYPREIAFPAGTGSCP